MRFSGLHSSCFADGSRPSTSALHSVDAAAQAAVPEVRDDIYFRVFGCFQVCRLFQVFLVCLRLF